MEEATSPDGRRGSRAEGSRSAPAGPAIENRRQRVGTYVRRQRIGLDSQVPSSSRAPLGTSSRKRGTKQVWLPIPVRVIDGEGESESGKRQRTSNVFDRLEDPMAVEGTGRGDSVFDRLEEQAADPARQGRRDQ
jgi:hypothetical protein